MFHDRVILGKVDLAPKAWSIQGSIGKLDIIKVKEKNFCLWNTKEKADCRLGEQNYQLSDRG